MDDQRAAPGDRPYPLRILMIQMFQGSFSHSEWRELVSDFQDLSLLQTWEYGEAKTRTGPWKVERTIFMDNSCLVGACQVMVRLIPFTSRGVAWINRGPLWRRPGRQDIKDLSTMLSQLRQTWAEDRGIYLRVALPLQNNEEGIRCLPPRGYSWVKNTVPWTSARLDLSSPLEALRGQMHQKWRNCLNKSERLGLSGEFGNDASLLGQVFEEYEKFLTKKDFKPVITPLFCRQLQVNGKLWGGIDRLGDQRLGGIIVACYGQTCEYLVGAVNEAGRATNATYFLLWQAICQMKQSGYQRFDLGGVNPQTTPPGIFSFKSGLKGTPYRMAGEIEAYDRSLFNHGIRWYITRTRDR
jgi:hypothetical protein